MLMRINHDPVRTHRSAALGNATIDHHLTVNTRAVSLQHKLTGFQGDIVQRPQLTIDLMPLTYQRPVAGSYSNQPPSGCSVTQASADVDGGAN